MEKKNRGSILIPLLVAMVVLGLIIATLASLQSSKHIAESFYVQSTQAYSIAQSGVEWGIRYATDNSSTFSTNPAALFPQTKSLGNGSFTVSYDSGTQKLTSTSTVQDGRRTIVLSSFPNYVIVQDIGLDPNNPPYVGSGVGAKNLYIPLINNTSANLYIFQIDLAKVGGGIASANEIWFGSTQVWIGTRVAVSKDPNNPTPFPFNQILSYTFPPGSITELIKFQAADAVSGGTWYCTFHYSVNADLSNPQTCTVSFVMP